MPSAANGVKIPDSDPTQHAINRSVIAEPPVGLGYGGDAGAAGWATLLFSLVNAGDEITPWGRAPSLRDAQLRAFLPTESILLSASASCAARNATFAWKLEGDEKLAEAYKGVLERSNQGKGWEDFIVKFSNDLYQQDKGAFIELIREDPKDPASPVIGVQTLDAQRCWHSGRPEAPVIYQDYYGRWHRLDRWNVVEIAEMPVPHETFYGLQWCAVTRVLRYAQIQRNIATYEDEKTGGRHTSAVHIISGVAPEAVQDAMTKRQAFSESQGLMRYVQPAIVSTLKPDGKVEHVEIDMTALPEGWNAEESMVRYLTIVSMGFMTDYQEFSPLPGKGLGTATQSKTLHEKSRGKGAGLFQKLILNLMNNHVLPEGVTFSWDEQDLDAETTEATNRLTRAQSRQTQVQAQEITASAATQIALDDGDISQEVYDAVMAERAAADAEKARIAAMPAVNENPTYTGGAIVDGSNGNQPTNPNDGTAANLRNDGQGVQAQNDTNPAGPSGQKQDALIAYGSAMVCLVPSPEVADALAMPGGEPASEMHVTLAFLPDGLTPDLRYRVEAALRILAVDSSPLDGTIAGVGRFTGGDEDAFYVSPDVPGLPELRQAVVAALVSARVNVADNHGFTPHMTVDYVAPGDPLPAQRVQSLPVRFDSLWLWTDGERIRIPLLSGGYKDDAIDYESERRAAEEDVAGTLGTVLRKMRDRIKNALGADAGADKFHEDLKRDLGQE